MVALEKAVTARLKSHGAHFEILVEPHMALSLRKGEDVDIMEMLAVDDIFENASQGDRAAEEDIIKAFGTTDLEEIARKIITDGDLQVTSEQRKQMQEEKRRKVVDVIVSNAINPQTNAPHPPARIEMAMDEAGVSIDPFKDVDQLVKEAVNAIRPLIPIRIEEVEIAVKIPPQYAARSYGEILNFGTITKQEWQNDGSWIGVVKIPAGLQNDLYSLVNRLTKGDAETKLLKKEA